MCIRVQRADTVTAPWSPTQDTLTIPAHIPESVLPDAVRWMLAEIGIDQPPHGAVCWCGDPVRVAPHIPLQRTREVMHRGA